MKVSRLDVVHNKEISKVGVSRAEKEVIEYIVRSRYETASRCVKYCEGKSQRESGTTAATQDRVDSAQKPK